MLEQLATVYAHAGRRQYKLAIDYALRWLAVDPLHEPAHRILMQLYAWSGDRTAALQQYQECERILGAEMGVAPEPETTALYLQIRSGELPESVGDRQAGEPPPPAAPARPLWAQRIGGALHDLPFQPTPFIGRSRELAQVAERLADPDCHLLTIVGPGGMGKTRLAIEAGHAAVNRFAHGVWLADLASVTSPELLPTVLLRTLGAPEGGVLDPKQRLLDYLADRQMLLVLDNVEHLASSATFVLELLQAAPALKLLATGRTRLHLREEWLLPLEGLDVPPAAEPAAPLAAFASADLGSDSPPTLADLEAYDATRLFLACVRRLQPGREFAPAELRLVAHICRLLEGMPLGIELAAAWTRTLSLAELAHEVEGGLRHLDTPLLDVPPRHRSIHAVFDHSWRLLDPHLQLRAAPVVGLSRRLYARGGRCRGRRRAQRSRRAGGRLVAARGPLGRYDMHELIRQYCAEHLEADPPAAVADRAEEVRNRHHAFYGAFLHEQMQRMNYQQEVMADLMADFGNLQAAWMWSVGHGDMGVAKDMVISLYFIGEMLDWGQFVIEMLESAATMLDSYLASPDGEPARRQAVANVLAWSTYACGFLYSHLGLLEPAEAAAARCTALAEELATGDERDEQRFLAAWLTASTVYARGDYAAARRLYRQQLRYLEDNAIDFSLYGSALGRRFWMAHVHAALGKTAWATGDYGTARRELKQSITLGEAMGEQRFRAFNLRMLATVEITSGNYLQAEELAKEGMQLSQTFGDRAGVAYSNLVLGQLQAAIGQLELATMHLRQALATGRQSGDCELAIVSLVALGRAALANGQPAEAKRDFAEALAFFSGLATTHCSFVAGALLGLGWAALAAHDIDEARRMFEQTLRAAGCTRWELLDATAGLGQVLAAQGQVESAVKLCSDVLQTRATAHTTRVYVEKLMEQLQATVVPG